MKRKTIISLLCIAFILGMAAPTLAATVTKTIEVITGINVYVNDRVVNPTDANGNPVDVFVYNGTTYLPVRALSNALGLNISWDGATSTVYVGEHEADGKPMLCLADLDYFTSIGSARIERNMVKDNLGIERDTTNITSRVSYTKNGSITYLLNCKYSRFTGLYFQTYTLRDSTKLESATIYGDGRELWTGTVTGGVKPIEIDIDLTGVIELKIVFSTNGSLSFNSYFGDTMFFS